jgi:hypothetical protein
MRGSFEVFIYPAVDRGTWVVEAVDRAELRHHEFTQFSGPSSEERARRYSLNEYGAARTEVRGRTEVHALRSPGTAAGGSEGGYDKA